MAKIIFNTHTTKNLIENAPDIEEKPRPYLGMSSIGKECSRQLFYGFRFAKKKILSVRLKRIFERGDIEEARIICDLKKIGIEVFRREGENKIEMTGEIGEKQEELIGFGGHAKGHPDGRLLNIIEAPKTEHLLEIKTMKASQFALFVKKGIKESHPVYFSQSQIYMKRMKLERTLLIATNKDDESREYERIKFDKEHAAELEQKEFQIITAETPENFAKFSKSYYQCRWCEFSDVCHENETPLKTCRSCEYVDLALDGKWVCTLNNDKELTLGDQLSACRQYRRLF